MYRILELNPQLAPFEGDINLRMHLYNETKKGRKCRMASFRLPSFLIPIS